VEFLITGVPNTFRENEMFTNKTLHGAYSFKEHMDSARYGAYTLAKVFELIQQITKC
jgi:hypothetical protein